MSCHKYEKWNKNEKNLAAVPLSSVIAMIAMKRNSESNRNEKHIHNIAKLIIINEMS